MFDMGLEPKDKIAHNNATIHARRPHVDQDCGASRISTTAEMYSVIAHSRDKEIGRFVKSLELLPAGGLCLSCMSSFCFQF